MGYDRVEHVRKGISGDGLGGTSGKRDCNRTSGRNLNISTNEALGIYSDTELLKRWTYVGSDALYAAVGESWKYDHKFQSGWGQQKLRRMQSWEGRALFCTYRWGHHEFFYRLGKRASAAGGLSHMGRGAALFTSVTANFWALSNAWQSWERMGEVACFAYPRYGRMNALYKGGKY